MDLEQKIKELGLTAKEERAFRGWQRDPEARPVAPETAGAMFALFINNYTCQQIQEQEQFRGFTLGAIVPSRLANDWDAGAREVAEKIRRSVMNQAERAGDETARTILDLVACANKKLGKEAREFLTGASAKPPIELDKVAHLKTLVDLLLLTKHQDYPRTAVSLPEPPTKPAEQPPEEERLPPNQQLASLANKRMSGGARA